MKRPSRREFLGKAVPGALMAGVGLTLLNPLGADAQQPQIPARIRTLPPPTLAPTQEGVADRFAVEIDQAFAGWPNSLEGGDVVADVVAAPAGPDGFQRKHLANLRYEEIVLTCGTGMSKPFFDWIKASFDRHPGTKSGAIVGVGRDLKPVSRVEWTNGLITEVTFPACDDSSKSNGLMTVKIAPRAMRTVGPAMAPGPSLISVRPWQTSNFALQIVGCETSCKSVSAIDALTVKFPLATNQGSGVRDSSKMAALVQVPDLTFFVEEHNATQFRQWQQSFEIQGQNGADKEKTGTLQYLAADLRSSLLTLNFAGLGIYALAPAMTGGIPRLKAQMYCDAIGFFVS